MASLWIYTTILTLLHVYTAEAWNRIACQTTLTNCPPNTTILTDNTSIQNTINSLPDDNTTQTILLLSGTYTEQLNITRHGPITLLGQTTLRTNQNPSKDTVTITHSAANQDPSGEKVDNVYSSVLIVAPTLEASLTGSGPKGHPVPEGTGYGNMDFRVYNIDFVNDWADHSDGPAHAMSFSRSNGGFYFCGFYSYQDTVYIGKLANAYIYNSVIAGQTDFLYGFGTAIIDSSALQLRNCAGGITAWKGTNTTFPNKYGIYIIDSTIHAANESIAPQIEGKCALGRPWNSLHRSIFALSFEDKSIRSAGYKDWVVDGVSRVTEETLMGEFRDFGPGFDPVGRVEGGLGELLDWEEWREYSSPERVFQTPDGRFGDVGWIDWEVVG